jgi:hypothetical protein
MMEAIRSHRNVGSYTSHTASHPRRRYYTYLYLFEYSNYSSEALHVKSSFLK